LDGGLAAVEAPRMIAARAMPDKRGIPAIQRDEGSCVPLQACCQHALLTGLAPVAGPLTRLLVLGSFPGAASLAAQQYYGHPRNHFWPILSALWGTDLRALPYAQRLQVMQQHGLGLWDVYARCRRRGSLDTAITDAEPNALAELAATLPQLRAIAHNGGESAKAMRITRTLGLPVLRLPSTSPANASWSFDRKRAAWGEAFAEYGIA
jgi:hypoxanthine-DNA glycosylase